MNNIFINCDLGEWEERSHTCALMQHIDLANIACGGHAGNIESIEECLELCKRYHVYAGAHPGLSGAAGRECNNLDVTTFKKELDLQLDRFFKACSNKKINPYHIKLHGSLYHLTESDHLLRNYFLDYLQSLGQSLKLICLSNGTVAHDAKSRHIPVLEEVFLDRAYENDGTLVSRSKEGAILHHTAQIKSRLENLQKGVVISHKAQTLKLPCHTLCVHSDSPDSLNSLQLARQILVK